MNMKARKVTEYLNSLRSFYNNAKKSKSFQFGLPFIVFVVGGSFGLQEWAQIRLCLYDLFCSLSASLLSIEDSSKWSCVQKNILQLRYSFSRVKGVSREEAQRMGLNKTNEVTLEDTYEEIKKIDIDNWENKRGPRPWEMNEGQNKK